MNALLPSLRCCLLVSLFASPAFATDVPVSNDGKDAAPVVPTGAPESTAALPHEAENAVVKVFSTMHYPDPFRPWTKRAPSDVTASGVVIENKRILTNAHVVLYAGQIEVQANRAGDKMAATIAAVAPDIDLAVLKLDDESFFDTRPPLQRASTLPEIKDVVLAYGFPAGGTSLSITKGIVSRIEFVPYSHSVAGLRIQIDAAINPGNSGGPAIAGDKMIGLAFSHLGNAQNIGYIIPNEEIDLFLEDIADGRYDGKPAMYDDLQTLENPALRAFLNLDGSMQGVVVHRPYKADASSPLKEWDVITRIADTPVDDQGMIKLGTNLRVNFRYLIQKVASNGRVPLTIIRNGKAQQIQLAVSSDRPMLIPDLKGAYPSYFIYGPLVFSTATQQILSLLNAKPEFINALSLIRSPLVTRRGDSPDTDHDELVIICSPLFPHKLSKGYSGPAGTVVYSVNGMQVHSLSHLVSLLRDLEDEFVVFELDNRGGEGLVFSRKEMVAATDEILSDNGIRAQGSADMLRIWQGKPAK